ncbi:translation initiation factor IF-2-like [Panicum virgatum]|uniref:translation initiation factor IF-2-like n=1 Tax=Panicum virgatum TaxID=38727 RepID=UPI0019D632D3|nr:translation initiation factor IF-2-like [Panicum virgatum]
MGVSTLSRMTTNRGLRALRWRWTRQYAWPRRAPSGLLAGDTSICLPRRPRRGPAPAVGQPRRGPAPARGGPDAATTARGGPDAASTARGGPDAASTAHGGRCPSVSEEGGEQESARGGERRMVLAAAAAREDGQAGKIGHSGRTRGKLAATGARRRRAGHRDEDARGSRGKGGAAARPGGTRRGRPRQGRQGRCRRVAAARLPGRHPHHSTPARAPPRPGCRRRRQARCCPAATRSAATGRGRVAPPYASPRVVVQQHAERSTAEVLRCARVRETEEKNRKKEDDKWGPLVIERR